MDAKIAILTLIKENKDALFGAFSKHLTKADKDAKWDEIAEQAKALGVLETNKNGKSLRSITWQNWRKRSIKKRDNINRGGLAGRKKHKIDASDQLLFEIIEKDSITFDGMDDLELFEDSTDESLTPANEPINISKPIALKFPRAPRARPRTNMNIPKKTEAEETHDKIKLQNELLRLQCEVQKREIYLKELAIFAKEDELKLTEQQKQEIFLISSEKFENSRYMLTYDNGQSDGEGPTEYTDENTESNDVVQIDSE